MAVQLPHDYRGVRMCDHATPGRCTWWCSYGRGVVCITPVVLLLVLGGAVRYLTAEDQASRDQVVYAFSGVTLFLAIAIPSVLWLNHKYPEQA